MADLTAPSRILLVDDNLADIRLMLEAVRLSGLDAVAEVAYTTDGERALDLLSGADHSGSSFAAVLLDLNMPKMSGQEVLKAIRQNDNHKNIAVFILTNSDGKADMDECRMLGADAFFQKPAEFKRLVDLFSALKGSLEIEGVAMAKATNTRYEELG
jgi:CheY-like chemotaxis protein